MVFTNPTSGGGNATYTEVETLFNGVLSGTQTQVFDLKGATEILIVQKAFNYPIQGDTRVTTGATGAWTTGDVDAMHDNDVNIGSAQITANAGGTATVDFGSIASRTIKIKGFVSVSTTSSGSGTSNLNCEFSTNNVTYVEQQVAVTVTVGPSQSGNTTTTYTVTPSASFRYVRFYGTKSGAGWAGGNMQVFEVYPTNNGLGTSTFQIERFDPVNSEWDVAVASSEFTDMNSGTATQKTTTILGDNQTKKFLLPSYSTSQSLLRGKLTVTDVVNINVQVYKINTNH